MTETERRIHPDGYVGLEVGRAIVILGFGNVRLPVLSRDERRWLIEELRKVDQEPS